MSHARGWTTEDLADRAAVPPSQIEELLDGSADVGVSVIVRLAAALEVEVDSLVGGIEWVPGPDGGEYRIGRPEAG